MSTDSQRVPLSKCLACGHEIDHVADPNGPLARAIQPGDAVLCIACGGAQTVDETGRLQPFSEAQIARMEANQEFMRQITRMARRIHFVRHAQN